MFEDLYGPRHQGISSSVKSIGVCSSSCYEDFLHCQSNKLGKSFSSAVFAKE